MGTDSSDDRFTQHILDEEKRLSEIERDLKDMSKRMETLEASVSDLVTAWRTAGGVVSFVKWLAGIATAILAFVAVMKLGIPK